MKYLDFKEDELFLISSLDYSQENAVIIAGSEPGLLIEGKKNSGKKETIINIISNSLYSQKRVLLVSKDGKSIENIYNRLGYIKTHCLLLNNNGFNLDSIYKNTNEKLTNISKNTGKTTLSKIKVLSRDIDKKFEMLNRINLLFNEKRSCGLNLIEMYTYTGQKISNSDSIYEYYNIFCIRKPFTNYKYDELKESVNNILNMDITDKYVKYRRFKKNKLFCNILKNINNANITEASTKIELSLNNTISLKLPILNSKYAKEIVEYFACNKLSTEDDFEEIAMKINKKYNYKENTNKLKRWNLIYWLKYKAIIKSENEMKVNYIKQHTNILNEIRDSVDVINKHLLQFSYLKDIVSKDEYNNFISVLLTTEDYVDYLINLKNTLNIYGTLISITDEIKSLGCKEKEVLEYCYDNIEIKEQIKDLLFNLPTIFLFHIIEEIETREKEVLYYYKNFEIILKEIQLSIDTKISFIPLSIKYIWDNKVSEKLLSNPEEGNMLFNIIEKNEKKMDVRELIETFNSLIFNIYPCFIINQEYVNNILPNIENLFDVIIFYDGNNIYPHEIDSHIYKAKSRIITSINSQYTEGSILDMYSEVYSKSNMEYEYSYNNINVDEEIYFNSYLQKEIYETFIKQGYKIKLNVNISGYIINILFYSRNYKNEILAIECDDAIYNINYNSRKFELSKRRCFEKRGLNLIRIWSRDWWLNKKTEIKKIQRLLDDSKIDKSIYR